MDKKSSGNETTNIKSAKQNNSTFAMQAQYCKVSLMGLLLLIVGCTIHTEKEENKDLSSETYDHLVEMAYDGDACAQSELGMRYYNGDGIEQDYEEAVKWYKKAIEQGDASAKSRLGVCYIEGKGMPKDTLEAIKWWLLSAEQGYATAQYNIGGSYYFGVGVPQNYNEAVKWYRKAAEQGYKDAQRRLGLCYYNGEGVKQSSKEAVEWYRKAAEQGDLYAQYNLGGCYADGDGVSQNWVEAVRWYRKAAEQGDKYSQFNLGVCYANGFGVPQDDKEADKWFGKAAAQGFPPAEDNIGGCDTKSDKMPLPEGWAYGKIEKFRGKTLEEKNMIDQYNTYTNALLKEDITKCSIYIYPDAIAYFKRIAPHSYSNEDIVKEFVKSSTGISNVLDTFSSMGWNCEMIMDSISKKISTNNTLIYVFSTRSNVYSENIFIHSTNKEMDVGISFDGGKKWTFMALNEDSPNILGMRFSKEIIDQLMKY